LGGVTSAALKPHDLADLALAPAGADRIAWAAGQMPVLAQISERFARERPLSDVQVAACLHVTAETANLVRALRAAGAEVSLCSANPLATQDEVAAALVYEHGVEVHARRNESFEEYETHISQVAASARASGRWVTIDDGADLLMETHALGADGAAGLIGGTEETVTGLLRLRRMQDAGTLRCPVLAVNEARTERALNDRHGTGQSALDGIIRASNVLLAGTTVVVLGYGWAGQGVAERARGAGAMVVICEVDPLRALEARMAGYEVMPAIEAAARGDVFITVTGSRRVLHAEHFETMKDGALLANAGHFDVEIARDELAAAALAPPRQVRPLVEQYELPDGRRLNLLAQGRVVNLAAGDGHPAAVMDVSFALQALSIEALVRSPGRFPIGVQPLPDAIDREVGRLKLAALGVAIDEQTEEQSSYRSAWS
jgi:adenosylhomocysteinase